MPSPSANAPTPLPRWLIALALVTASVAFLPTLGGGFLGDDFVYVSRFREFAWRDWTRLFTHEWSEGIWGFPLKELRPFAALSFMVDARLWDGNALGYRLTNLTLHAAVTILVLRLAWNYSRGSVTAAAVAALTFAMHPAHVEAVAWITGRVDLLATVGALGFWLTAERWAEKGEGWRLALSGVGFFLGLFSKELCLFAPPLLLLRWLLVDPRAGRAVWVRRGVVLGTAVVIVGIYAMCRYAAFGADVSAAPGGWHDDAAWDRQASYLGWLAPILPFTARSEWASPLAPALLRAIWVGLATLTIAGISWAIMKRRRDVAEGLFFTGVWYLIAVGGFLLVGYFSPRHLYFPTTGLSIGLGLVAATVGGSRWVRTVVGVALVGWCAAAHLVVMRSWTQAGVLSREITSNLNRGFASATPGTLVLVSAPEVVGFAYVWAWGSPHALGAPFLARPVPADDVLERQGNYFQPDNWPKARHQVARLKSAPAAVALVADLPHGVRMRLVSRDELQSRAATLESFARDGLSTEEWTDWVTTLLEP